MVQQSFLLVFLDAAGAASLLTKVSDIGEEGLEADARKQVMVSPMVENFVALQADFQHQLAALRNLTDDWQLGGGGDSVETGADLYNNTNKFDIFKSFDSVASAAFNMDEKMVPRAVHDLELNDKGPTFATVKTQQKQNSEIPQDTFHDLPQTATKEQENETETMNQTVNEDLEETQQLEAKEEIVGKLEHVEINHETIEPIVESKTGLLEKLEEVDEKRESVTLEENFVPIKGQLESISTEDSVGEKNRSAEADTLVEAGVISKETVPVVEELTSPKESSPSGSSVQSVAVEQLLIAVKSLPEQLIGPLAAALNLLSPKPAADSIPGESEKEKNREIDEKVIAETNKVTDNTETETNPNSELVDSKSNRITLEPQVSTAHTMPEPQKDATLTNNSDLIEARPANDNAVDRKLMGSMIEQKKAEPVERDSRSEEASSTHQQMEQDPEVTRENETVPTLPKVLSPNIENLNSTQVAKVDTVSGPSLVMADKIMISTIATEPKIDPTREMIPDPVLVEKKPEVQTSVKMEPTNVEALQTENNGTSTRVLNNLTEDLPSTMINAPRMKSAVQLILVQRPEITSTLMRESFQVSSEIVEEPLPLVSKSEVPAVDPKSVESSNKPNIIIADPEPLVEKVEKKVLKPLEIKQSEILSITENTEELDNLPLDAIPKPSTSEIKIQEPTTLNSVSQSQIETATCAEVIEKPEALPLLPEVTDSDSSYDSFDSVPEAEQRIEMSSIHLVEFKVPEKTDEILPEPKLQTEEKIDSRESENTSKSTVEIPAPELEESASRDEITSPKSRIKSRSKSPVKKVSCRRKSPVKLNKRSVNAMRLGCTPNSKTLSKAKETANRIMDKVGPKVAPKVNQTKQFGTNKVNERINSAKTINSREKINLKDLNTSKTAITKPEIQTSVQKINTVTKSKVSKDVPPVSSPLVKASKPVNKKPTPSRTPVGKGKIVAKIPAVKTSETSNKVRILPSTIKHTVESRIPVPSRIPVSNNSKENAAKLISAVLCKKTNPTIPTKTAVYSCPTVSRPTSSKVKAVQRTAPISKDEKIIPKETEMRNNVVQSQVKIENRPEPVRKMPELIDPTNSVGITDESESGEETDSVGIIDTDNYSSSEDERDYLEERSHENSITFEESGDDSDQDLSSVLDSDLEEHSEELTDAEYMLQKTLDKINAEISEYESEDEDEELRSSSELRVEIESNDTLGTAENNEADEIPKEEEEESESEIEENLENVLHEEREEDKPKPDESPPDRIKKPVKMSKNQIGKSIKSRNSGFTKFETGSKGRIKKRGNFSLVASFIERFEGDEKPRSFGKSSGGKEEEELKDEENKDTKKLENNGTDDREVSRRVPNTPTCQ